MGLGEITVVRHCAGGDWWEMARRAPLPTLAGQVREYCGYVERTAAPLRRREVANGGVVLILNLGEPIDVVEMSNSPTPAGTFRSFVAGFHEGYTLTEHPGSQFGVEVLLTPLGAYRLLGIPMREVANQVVELDALRGRKVDELVDRLAGAPSWAERFGLLDEVLSRWAADGLEPDAPVEWAWRQLERSYGRVAVGVMADEIGWSRRHFVTRFRDQVGLAPKPTGRVLRFRGAVELLQQTRMRTIAEVAAAAGYADHSHLVREFRSLAGCTPSALMTAQLPDSGGVAG